jgi:hypothetical protein
LQEASNLWKIRSGIVECGVMVNPSLTLSLSASMPDARIAGLTRNLARDLNRHGIKAHLEESALTPGARGEPVTLGVLALALVTSGTIKALIECLKAYLSREHSLTIKLERTDGSQVEVNARNVDTADIRATLEAVASGTSG